MQSTIQAVLPPYKRATILGTKLILTGSGGGYFAWRYAWVVGIVPGGQAVTLLRTTLTGQNGKAALLLSLSLSLSVCLSVCLCVCV